LARTLHFLANLDPLDGSAHALYCARNAISLAKNSPPGWRVVLVHASAASPKKILSLHETPGIPHLELLGLPNLRRQKWMPLHLNAIFHHAAARHLRTRAIAGDLVCTASFPEMFRFLAGKLAGTGVRLVYEVHQLEMQSRDRSHPKCAREFEALARADLFVTTCEPLVEILNKDFPEIPCRNLGLAATYSPVDVRPPNDGIFRMGYFGSLSPEQGVPWLAEEWKTLRALCGGKVEFHSHGRTRRNEKPVPSDPSNGFHSHGPIPSNSVPAACAGLNALVIPALDQAHRASIAFTKAYDFAGLGLPVLASDLPTIREVLPPDTHALYFEPGNAKSLANRINRLSADPALAAAMSANLRQRAVELSWDNRARRWWEAVLE